MFIQKKVLIYKEKQVYSGVELSVNKKSISKICTAPHVYISNSDLYINICTHGKTVSNLVFLFLAKLLKDPEDMVCKEPFALKNCCCSLF